MAGHAAEDIGVLVVNLPGEYPLSPGTPFGCGIVLGRVFRMLIQRAIPELAAPQRGVEMGARIVVEIPDARVLQDPLDHEESQITVTGPCTRLALQGLLEKLLVEAVPADLRWRRLQGEVVRPPGGEPGAVAEKLFERDPLFVRRYGGGGEKVPERELRVQPSLAHEGQHCQGGCQGFGQRGQVETGKGVHGPWPWQQGGVSHRLEEQELPAASHEEHGSREGTVIDPGCQEPPNPPCAAHGAVAVS
jgi:hypothetical protein